MTEVYRRKPVPPDWPRPTSIVTREIDVSSGLLATQYCPRNLVTTEFYISGTEPTRDCDKHGPFANPGGAYPVDTFSTVPFTPAQPPTSGGQPINATPPPVQPGYEPVPSRGQPPPRRIPTVFDTTTRRDTLLRRPTTVDTSLHRVPRRDSVRRDTIRRDTTRPRTDTIPSPGRPPTPIPR